MKKALCCWLLLSLFSPMAVAQTPYLVSYHDVTAPLVPVVRAIYAEMGITAEFELVPIERAVALTDRGDYDAEVSRVSDALANYFNIVQTQEPLRTIELHAYVKKGSDIVLQNADDLQYYRIGMFRGAKLAKVFALSEGLKPVEALSLETLAKMLDAGRFDVALITTVQVAAYSEEILSVAERVGPVLSSSPAYHVLNKRNAGLAARFDEIIRAMRADGRMARYLGNP